MSAKRAFFAVNGEFFLLKEGKTAKKSIAVMSFLCHNRTNMGGHPGSIRPAECGPKADGCFSPRFADGTMLLRSGKRSIHKESFQ